jgi:protein-S-isoprenylcysteine O-methyltransferase Ste14
MINHVRFFLGVLHVIVLPLGTLFWLVIHPWARWWRKLGPVRTYLIVVPVLAVLGALLFGVRRALLGEDLGTNWSLIVVALILLGPITWLEVQYWRQLSIATLVGVPELSPVDSRKGKLLREGIYGVVRHPRYLSAGLGVIANALFINYVGMYVLILLILPLGFVLLTLEERELVDRFGDAYRQYQRDVPQLIPRLRSKR